VWGCEEKANEKGEQIKKKRKQKGQFPRVPREFFKGRKGLSERICFKLFALKKSCTRNAILIKVALV